MEHEYLTYVDETEFYEGRKKRKTKVIRVRSKRSGETLGFIKWYGAWRQYAFFPEPSTIWNPDCLNHINETIAELKAERSQRTKGPYDGFSTPHDGSHWDCGKCGTACW